VVCSHFFELANDAEKKEGIDDPARTVSNDLNRDDPA